MISKRWILVLVAGVMLVGRAAGAQPAGPVAPAEPSQALAPFAAEPLGSDLLAAKSGDDPAGPAESDRPGAGRGGKWRMGAGRGAGFGRGALASELGLTADQRDKLAGIRDRQMRRAIQARADLALERLDLRKLLRADPPNRASIDAQIDRIARTRAQLAKERVAAMLEMRGVLTPDQRKMLRERRGGMGGRGWGRGRGAEGGPEGGPEGGIE